MQRELLLQLLAAASSGTELPPAMVAGVKVTPVHVAGGVHVLRGAGANLGVCVGRGASLLADTAFIGVADAVRAALESIGAGRPDVVVNTHWHLDHTHGNQALAAGATLVSTSAAARHLAEHRSGLGSGSSGPVPAITLDHPAHLDLGGERVLLRPAGPAHTGGDLFLHYEDSNVVQLGDCFVTWGFPFVDHDHGGSMAGLMASVEAALAVAPDDVIVIPGHGPVSSKADVLRFTSAVRECSGLVQDALARGWSEHEIRASRALEPYAALGRGFVTTAAFVSQVAAEARRGA